MGDIELSEGKIASAMSAHMYKVVGLEQRSKKWNLFLHCKKGKVVFIQFGYLSFLLSACIVKHSGVPLPALDSKQIKNLIWLSSWEDTLLMKFVQSCGKGYETEVTKIQCSLSCPNHLLLEPMKAVGMRG